MRAAAPPPAMISRAAPPAHPWLTRAPHRVRPRQGGLRRQRAVWPGLVRNLCASQDTEHPSSHEGPAIGRLCRVRHERRLGRRPRAPVFTPVRAGPRARHLPRRRSVMLVLRGARLTARVQGVRWLLPEVAQDGGARRRARGAVLPAVPPRVPKDHGVAAKHEKSAPADPVTAGWDSA